MELKICFHRANFTRARPRVSKIRVHSYDKGRAKREKLYSIVFRFQPRVLRAARNQLSTADNTWNVSGSAIQIREWELLFFLTFSPQR